MPRNAEISVNIIKYHHDIEHIFEHSPLGATKATNGSPRPQPDAPKAPVLASKGTQALTAPDYFSARTKAVYRPVESGQISSVGSASAATSASGSTTTTVALVRFFGAGAKPKNAVKTSLATLTLSSWASVSSPSTP